MDVLSVGNASPWRGLMLHWNLVVFIVEVPDLLDCVRSRSVYSN